MTNRLELVCPACMMVLLQRCLASLTIKCLKTIIGGYTDGHKRDNICELWENKTISYMVPGAGLEPTSYLFIIIDYIISSIYPHTP